MPVPGQFLNTGNLGNVEKMKPTVLKSPRTLLRPFEPDDVEEAFTWLGDPEVMRFMPTEPDASTLETSSRIERYINLQVQHGFSRWPIIEKESGRLIGDAGFLYLPDQQRVELGYRLAKAYWGKGLATEVARKWVEMANLFLDSSHLYAFAHPENAASHHILQNVGFQAIGKEMVYGSGVPMYSIQLGRG